MNENLGTKSKRVAGVEGQVPPRFSPPPARDPLESLPRHLLRCLLCRIGDPYCTDRLCQKARDIILRDADEEFQRQWDQRYADEERDLAEMADWRDYS